MVRGTASPVENIIVHTVQLNDVFSTSELENNQIPISSLCPTSLLTCKMVVDVSSQLIRENGSK